jgi:capsid protein
MASKQSEPGVPWGVWDVTAANLIPEQKSTSRAWEAADTNRLNSAHWQNVSDDPLQDLRTDLPELQRRARHEALNNGLIDGAIETQTTNVVGAKGPALQILTEDNRWNDDVEAIWAAWSSECEYAEGLGIVDLIEGWVAQWAIYGEILCREIIGRGVARYKLFDLGPESIDTTFFAANVHSGVICDETGRVTGYRLHDPANTSDKSELSWELALHVYRRRFAQQRRGFPGLASVLQPTADLRDFDDQVQDAARAAADHAVFFVSNHVDAEFVEPTEKTLPWKRRTRQYIRPGWDVRQLQAHQPAATYRDFRKEKQTDIGGSMEMPWMILRKDASNHNMSAARFDASRYQKTIERFQSRLERRALNFIVRRLVRLAQYEKILGPTPVPKRFEQLRFEFPNLLLPISWTWPKPPPVDNLKDALAERTKLENGTLSLTEAIIADGRRPEETLRIRSRDNEALIAAGLPPLMGAIPTQTTPEAIAAAMADPGDGNVNDGSESPETPTPDVATDPED